MRCNVDVVECEDIVTGDSWEPDALTAHPGAPGVLRGVGESIEQGCNLVTPPQETGGNSEHKPRPKLERSQSTRPERRTARLIEVEVIGRGPVTLVVRQEECGGYTSTIYLIDRRVTRCLSAIRKLNLHGR